MRLTRPPQIRRRARLRLATSASPCLPRSQGSTGGPQQRTAPRPPARDGAHLGHAGPHRGHRPRHRPWPSRPPGRPRPRPRQHHRPAARTGAMGHAPTRHRRHAQPRRRRLHHQAPRRDTSRLSHAAQVKRERGLSRSGSAYPHQWTARLRRNSRGQPPRTRPWCPAWPGWLTGAWYRRVPRTCRKGHFQSFWLLAAPGTPSADLLSRGEPGSRQA